jgi:gas vesicle protein
MNSGKVLLGVLAGIGAGAMVGILFAPDKGTRTRKKILTKGEDYADGLKEKFDDFLDNMTEQFGSAKQDAEVSVAKGKTKFEEFKKEAKQAIDHK